MIARDPELPYPCPAPLLSSHEIPDEGIYTWGIEASLASEHHFTTETHELLSALLPVHSSGKNWETIVS